MRLRNLRLYGGLALIIFVLLTVFCFVHASRQIDWIGDEEIEFVFVVLDAAKREPISGATIRLVDDPGTVRRTMVTDSNGGVNFRESCPTSGRGGVLSRTGKVHFPGWGFQVSKEGYEPSRIEWLGDPLGQITELGRGKPVVIEIRLERKHQ